MSNSPFAASAPISVARIGLRAKDADGLSGYYRDIIGLTELSRDGETVTLGTPSRPLLVIEGDKSLQPDDPRSAGLFHTAFLLPGRADLGRWINRAVEKRIAVEGASDHLVSEALYLTDPEGNGIEIYADRAPQDWRQENGQLKMATLRMDIPGVRASVPADDIGWSGMPDDSMIGHVHLRVGDPVAAEAWWQTEMGFETMAKYGTDAVFLATGGYHHHVGANAWQSRGAGTRDDARTGLGWVELAIKDGAKAGSDRRDPWGTVIKTFAA